MPIRPYHSALLAVAALIVLGSALLAAPPPAHSYSSGAIAGVAGDQFRSDGTAITCAVCHGSFELNAGDGSIEVEAAATAAPGDAVPITITLDNQTPPATEGSGRQGFEATVRDPETGDLWGRLLLTDAVDTKYASADSSYVTHTLSGTARTTWTFDWEPGTERSGTARVYVAGNAANGDGSPSGDYIYAATADVVVGEVAAEASPEAAFEVSAPRPNPVRRGGVARLTLTQARAGVVTATLVDGLGRTVRRLATGERVTGRSVLSVPTAGLAAGTYFVAVDGPGGRRMQPVVVAR